MSNSEKDKEPKKTIAFTTSFESKGTTSSTTIFVPLGEDNTPLNGSESAFGTLGRIRFDAVVQDQRWLFWRRVIVLTIWAASFSVAFWAITGEGWIVYLIPMFFVPLLYGERTSGDELEVAYEEFHQTEVSLYTAIGAEVESLIDYYS